VRFSSRIWQIEAVLCKISSSGIYFALPISPLFGVFQERGKSERWKPFRKTGTKLEHGKAAEERGFRCKPMAFKELAG
jgi:hypothetical protein